MQTDEKFLNRVKWNYMILDEAQAIKNSLTQRSRAAKQLSADFRLITTGTPIENHLGELWSLFDFLMPGFLGTQRGFEAFFRRPIEKFNKLFHDAYTA